MEKVSSPDAEIDLTPKERLEMLDLDVRRIREEMQAIRNRYGHPTYIAGADKERLGILSAELDVALRDIGLLKKENRLSQE